MQENAHLKEVLSQTRHGAQAMTSVINTLGKTERKPHVATSELLQRLQAEKEAPQDAPVGAQQRASAAGAHAALLCPARLGSARLGS